jgi:methylated-DNA-[protein]-cysteine S-methyltransferase
MGVDVCTAYSTMMTPIGEILISARAEGVSGISFEERWSPSGVPAQSGDKLSLEMVRWARTELDAYFAGALQLFSVPFLLNGTQFQENVWTALRSIPYGEVVSYRDIADRIGNRKAVRAVGAANGQNPVPIIIPCHRVIGTDGSLTGFGGGLPRKQWLLEHEGALTGHLIS